MTHTMNSNTGGSRKKRILWLTDTIIDLNGVAVTLKNIGWLAHKRGDEIYIVSSLGEHELNDSLPPNYVNLKPLLNIYFAVARQFSLIATAMSCGRLSAGSLLALNSFLLKL